MAASTSSANIVKILINYSEYARLKDIEEKYTQLQKKYKDKLHIEEGILLKLLFYGHGMPYFTILCNL
jgi:hypothetical protein